MMDCFKGFAPGSDQKRRSRTPQVVDAAEPAKPLTRASAPLARAADGRSGGGCRVGGEKVLKGLAPRRSWVRSALAWPLCLGFGFLLGLAARHARQARHAGHLTHASEVQQASEAAAAAACRESDSASCAGTSSLSLATPPLALAAPTWQGGDALWPACVFEGVALRGAGAMAALSGLSGLSGVAVCPGGAPCIGADTLAVPKAEDCARICAAVAECRFWAHGGAEQPACYLKVDDASSEQGVGFSAGRRDCAPPPTEVTPMQAVNGVLASEALRACDTAVENEACADLGDAMQTWLYGIRQLGALGVEGTMAQHVDQITTDSERFPSLAPGDPRRHEAYRVYADNNRQVLQAIVSQYAWQTNSEASPLSPLDLSVPRPARGLLCAGTCAA